MLLLLVAVAELALPQPFIVRKPDAAAFTTGQAEPIARGLNVPYDVAIESAGNLWVTNSKAEPGTVSKLDPLCNLIGTFLSGGEHPKGVAIDYARGSIWVVNSKSNCVGKLDLSGT